MYAGEILRYFVSRLNTLCDFRFVLGDITSVKLSSVSCSGVFPLWVWMSSSEENGVGTLIYQWMVSEFSGNAFPHPPQSVETHVD